MWVATELGLEHFKAILHRVYEQPMIAERRGNHGYPDPSHPERSGPIIAGDRERAFDDGRHMSDLPVLTALDMCCACRQAVAMSKMIQLRHVPDELHRKLKASAALAGLSLSDYLLEEVRRVAERPTVAELRNRLASRTPVVPRLSPVKAVRAERDSR